jgi:serine protease Do
MNDLNKHQLVLLVLLVSFITALVTGIVTATLVSQAPAQLTNTIQRVIEKVVEKTTDVTPAPLKKDETKELEYSAFARDILIEDIVVRASPAVVSVIATKDVTIVEQYYANPFSGDDFFNQFFQEFQVPQLRQQGTEKRQISSGTGFFVSQDGLLITNKHVVDDIDADYSILTNDQKKFSAKVIARDPLNDVAILKVIEPLTGVQFSFIVLGDSENVKIGQTAIAIGNSLGEFQNTVSVGVISGLRRTIVASGARSGPEELSEIIQTDAAINPGNSGGPLLNLKGDAIGLSVAMAQSAENIGFAIPINQVRRSYDEAREKGKITYPYLGVRHTLVTSELQSKQKLLVNYGAMVVAGKNGEEPVLPNSPASKAGILENDIILEIEGVKISQENTLAKLIQHRSIGDRVKLKILRNGGELALEAVLEERKDF